MDVLAAAGPSASPPIPAAYSSPSPAPPAETPAPAPAPAAAAPVTPAPVPTVAATNAAPAAPAHPAGETGDGTLKPVVAKLFNASEQNIEVSFQVVKDLDEVITVFTDKSTGKEIVQFPSAALIALAEFFSKLADNVPAPGNVLDTRR